MGRGRWVGERGYRQLRTGRHFTTVSTFLALTRPLPSTQVSLITIWRTWLSIPLDTRGIKPLVIWKLVQPNTPFAFPPDALQIGHDGSGQPLFSARAWHEGGLQLGKAGPHLNRGCSISYGGAEIQTDTYEVLCAARPDPALLKWMCFNHGEEMRVEGWQPVEGGRERDGQSLFVAKGEWEG